MEMLLSIILEIKVYALIIYFMRDESVGGIRWKEYEVFILFIMKNCGCQYIL